MFKLACLFGCDESHVIDCGSDNKLSAEVHSAFLSLAERARCEGFDLKIASAYRGFERQKSIWNAKACGQRAILDSDGQILDRSTLGEQALLEAILRWSAIPGASRHHWGTDFDIYDASALSEGQVLQLTLEETQKGGPFYEMYCWLDDYLENQSDFFRPYLKDRGGVASEPWHMSYAPLAKNYLRLLSKDALFAFLSDQEFALKSILLHRFDEIYERYVVNIASD